MRYKVTLSAIVLILLGQACLGPVRVAQPVHESQDRFVRVEARYGDPRRDGAVRFAHPLALNPDEWTRILSRIQIQSHKDSFLFTTAKDPPMPAFAPDEIAYLSAKLSEAFARAHPDEWVLFGLSRARTPQLTEITTGGWFVEGPVLHLILANYRHGVTRFSIREQLWQDPLHSDTALFVELVPGDYLTVGPGKRSLSRLLTADGLELSIAYQALLEAKPILQSAPAPRGASPKEPEERPPSKLAPATPLDPTLEERLRTLKGLREQGLITEEEYREKKKQLLDRF